MREEAELKTTTTKNTRFESKREEKIYYFVFRNKKAKPVPDSRMFFFPSVPLSYAEDENNNKNEEIYRE